MQYNHGKTIRTQTLLLIFKLKPLFLIMAILLCSVFLTSPAYAFCFDEAGKMYSVSSSILRAIAEVESKFNPDAVNYNKNGSYDYGLMISHPKYVFM